MSARSKAEGLLAERTRAKPLDGEKEVSPARWTRFTPPIQSRNYESLSTILHRVLGMAGAETIKRPYQENTWVYTCITEFASAVKSVPAFLWKGDPRDDSKDSPKAERIGSSNPIARLLTTNANKHQTQGEFREAGVTHLKLDGENMWFLFGAKNEPVAVSTDGTIEVPAAIIPIRGSRVRIKLDDYGFPEEYGFPARDGPIWFPPEAVVHFRLYDPDNAMRGLGPAEVLARELSVQFGAERMQESLFRNGGDPGIYLLLPGPYGGAERDALQAELDDEQQVVENRGRTKILANMKDAKLVQNHQSPRDMEFQDGLTWIREAICSVMGVPPPVIGIYDRATFRNFETAVDMFWTGGRGVVPYLKSEEESIDTFFLPRMRARGIDLGDDVVFRYDLDAIDALKDDMLAKLEAAAKLSEGGNPVSWNKATELVGLDVEPLDDGDEVLVPGSTQRLEDVGKEIDGGSGSPNTDDGEKGKGGSDSRPNNSLPSMESKEAVDADPPASPEEEIDEEERAYEERREYAEKIEKGVREKSDKRLKRESRRYLGAYERAQRKRVRDFAETGKAAPSTITKLDSATIAGEQLSKLLLSRDEWDANFAQRMAPLLERGFLEASLEVAAEIGGEAFAATDPLVIEFLEKQTITLVEGVDGRLAETIRQAMLEVIREGPHTIGSLQKIVKANLPELDARLRRVFGNKDARASTIARTETGHASNGARFNTMKKEGIKKHTWVTARDEVVRGTDPSDKYDHAALDGKTVEIGKEFSPRLRYPNDPRAAAGDVINCRCLTRPEI